MSVQDKMKNDHIFWKFQMMFLAAILVDFIGGVIFLISSAGPSNTIMVIGCILLLPGMVGMLFFSPR